MMKLERKRKSSRVEIQRVKHRVNASSSSTCHGPFCPTPPPQPHSNEIQRSSATRWSPHVHELLSTCRPTASTPCTGALSSRRSNRLPVVTDSATTRTRVCTEDCACAGAFPSCDTLHHASRQSLADSDPTPHLPLCIDVASASVVSSTCVPRAVASIRGLLFVDGRHLEGALRRAPLSGHAQSLPRNCRGVRRL